MCNYEKQDCDLDCSRLTLQPIHDYGYPKGSRCVAKCDAPNSILSYNRDNADFGFSVRVPYCAYCGDGCVDCREDEVDGHLWCAKCGLDSNGDQTFAYKDTCVTECPAPSV